jgi:G3E family GTPase
MSSVPVSVIGGYLGAGKTTLVNRWLRQARAADRRLAVLVNDFGEIGIDADLIVARRDDVIELAGGCVCCSVGGDLVAALESLRARDPAPDRILLETSGVALPGTVAATARLARGLAVDPVLVLADAASVRARAADPYVADTVLRQLARAERVLLSRVDLITPPQLAEVRAWLAEIVPGTPVALAADEPLPGATAPTVAAPRAAASGLAVPSEAAAAFDSVSARFEHAVDLPGLAHDLGDPVLGLERAKGILTGPGARLWSIELAGGSVRVSPLPADADAAVAGAAMTAPAAVPGRLVCIGLRARLDRAALLRLIARHGGEPIAASAG